jgi:hypothetical protein
MQSDEIIDCLRIIEEHQDIIILKLDGVRKDNKFTVIITSGSSSFDSIRREGNDMEVP